MTLDLAVLALLAVSALAGAASGALRQLASLGAVVLGALAARAWTDDVAGGLARTFRPLARLVAPLLLFFGVAALVSLVAALLLRGTGLARVVQGPADRGGGALLGAAKGALAAWVLLSALALADPYAPAPLRRLARESDAAALARTHNLVARVDPDAARAVERALAAARQVQRAGRLARDPDAARLLAHPRIRELERAAKGAPLDEERSARALEDPETRALVERLARRGRAAP